MLDEIEICHNKIAQAVWALDRHMWTMLCEYLPTESIREQLQGMQTGAWIQEHGKSASWQDLIDALDKFIKLCNQSKWNEAVDQWNIEVYVAQQFLPVHVVNQYCHPTRSFSPSPNFNDASALPRCRKTNVGEWFTLAEHGMDNNKNWAAFYRGGAISATMWPLPAKGAVWMNGKGAPAIDRAACDTYLKSRIQLRDKLLADIRVELNKRSKSILGVV